MLFTHTCIGIAVAYTDLFDLFSYVIGDTSILGEIGLNSMEDVESLTAPPELKSESSSSTFQGGIDYFICTRHW